MPKIFVPTTGPDDWRRLLASPEKHWRDGYSAKSAAERWEGAAGALPQEIARQFEKAGLGPAELLLAVPEWKTPLPGGIRESQTDIFALIRAAGGVYACAIEAKVEESFDKTVDEWRSDAPSPGKLERLDFLCRTLGLDASRCGSLRYQLFHRTAAALIEAERFGCAGAAMIVQSFSPHRSWLSDFTAFTQALGAEATADAPALLTRADGRPLLLAWASAA